MKKIIWSGVAVLSMCLLMGCGEKEVASTNLTNVVIDGYVVNTGKNDVFDQRIPISDVKAVLGDAYTDEMYDYSQGFRKMTYHDEVNQVTMEFVYLKTEDGKIVNWIEMGDM